jgi:arylsulfatase A-like enzyme
VPARNALKELMRIAFGAAVLTGLANTFWLAFHSEGARVLQTGFLLILPLLTRLGQSLVDTPGPWLATYYDLEGWREMLIFLPRVILTSLVVNLVLALAVGLVLLAVSKVAPARKRATSLILRAGFPALVLSPIVLVPAEDLLYSYISSSGSRPGLWSRLYAILIAGFVSLLAWMVFLMIDRSRERKAVSAVLGKAGVVLGTVVLAGWAIAAVTQRQPDRPAGNGPNVLLVSIDSLRADHLHCYGYSRETSPNIDRLAREGARFQTAVAPTSWTLPSHMSLLTSLDPLHHGVISDLTRLPRHAVTLAEVFQHSGYTTAGFVSSAYLHARWGYSQGFDLYDDYSAGNSAVLGGREVRVTSPRLSDRVRRWIKGWNADGRKRPFFMFVHMMDVHYDYLPPAPYDTMFDPDYRGEISGKGFIADRRINRHIARRDLEHILALYDGEVRFTDEHLGKIIGDLSSLNILDNTMIAVTSDHGDEFFEHGWKGHRESLYDEVVLVPMVVRYPKSIPANTVVETQVRLIDLGSTLMPLAGIKETLGYAKARSLYAARDLTPLIMSASARSAGDKRLNGSHEHTDGLPAFLHLTEIFNARPGPLFGVRSGGGKLIISPDKGAVEVYDLTVDAAEQQNLIAKEHARVAPLKTMLENWRSQGLRSSARSGRLGAKEMEQLRDLGYLQ